MKLAPDAVALGFLAGALAFVGIYYAIKPALIDRVGLEILRAFQTAPPEVLGPARLLYGDVAAGVLATAVKTALRKELP